MKVVVLRVLLVIVGFMFSLGAGQAQDLSALAHLDPKASHVVKQGGGVDVVLAISQPVPWRVRVLDEPPRLSHGFS